jgi:Asp-tRNA(Asn)/Glu-tRNA(Gln) amidotransferase C subunit
MKLDDLKVTARLAHLGLSEEDLGSALPAFEQMLDYFAVMQTVDGSMAGTTGTADIEAVHSDLVLSVHQFNNNSLTHSANFNSPNNPGNHNDNPIANHNLLNQAGERNGNFIVVPNVL